jgi:predicted DNA-binding protein (UPF0251 family)
MATDPQISLTPEEGRLLRQLAEWAGLDPAQAAHHLVEVGLTALRLEAALHLYATTPLSTGEIADRTGVDRGALLRAVQARGIAPYDDPALDPVALATTLNARVTQRVARWTGTPPPTDPH